MKDKPTVGIIGLGLMGGSFGRTLVKKGYRVLAFDVKSEVMLKGELMSAFTEPLTAKNAKFADILVVSVAPERFSDAVTPFLPFLKKGAVVTDFCGVKRTVTKKMREFSERYENLCFIGGHPMAGREFSGIEHSSVNLFDKASMILVPVRADIFQVEAVKNFFLSVGFARVVLTTAEYHDEVIAYTSQLCHIVSNAFIKNASAEKRSGYSAGSFKDLTRVARMDADLWTELIFCNRDNALRELDELILNLNSYRAAIEDGDRERLKRLFKDGSDRKIKIESETR